MALTKADLANLRSMIEEVVDERITVALTGTTEVTAPAKNYTPRTEAQKKAGAARYAKKWAALKKANPGVDNKALAKAHRKALNACWK